MSVDPAELIFFGEMNPKAFFEQAKRMGVPTRQLEDKPTRDHVWRSCLQEIRVATVQGVAGRLGISLTEDQTRTIAAHSLVPEVNLDPVSLSDEEREKAEELYYHAVKAAVARHGRTITEKAARADARKMIFTGERGLTRVQRMCRKGGCLVVLGMFSLAAGSMLVVVCSRQ